MSWRVFFVPKWQQSVVEKTRNLSYNSTTKQLTFDDTPTLPTLTVQTANPQQATYSDTNYEYTLTIHHSQYSDADYFLGQLLKKQKNSTKYWYDTILAVDTKILLNSMSGGNSALIFEVPAGKWLKISHMGSIDTTNKKLNVQTSSNTSIAFPFTGPLSPQNLAIHSNGHTIDNTTYRFGALFVNQLKQNGLPRNVLFGHFHWGNDFGVYGEEEPFGPGDQTEPFVAIQPPPPPHCGDPREGENS